SRAPPWTHQLDASMEALGKKENRLALKRRFDSPNYWRMHMDMPMAAGIVEMTGGGPILGQSDVLTELFNVPLEVEVAFDSKPESVLVSIAANLLESLADATRYKDMKPVKGGNLFLAGGGKLLLALSAPLTFRGADLKAHPELAASWDQLVAGLETVRITEGDVEDLLNGSFTLALGSDATVMGSNIPGVYIALTGRKGAAAKILGKLMENEQFAQLVPLIPLQVDGWDSVFAVSPEEFPAPLVFGVTGDTLFMGVLNSDALGQTPEIPAGLAAMLDSSLLGIGVADVAGIWNWLRREVADPNSLLSSVMDDDVKGILDTLFEEEAEPSVSFFKLWATDPGTAFMEFSVEDVPQEKSLLPRLLKAAQLAASQQDEE
ncbi:MAG: hypothetical protein FWF95_08445, partial [Syntrophorhabdaceae bacterium]|nr:hypothetical protein [Syntrophorhabdaceae bacterium]